MTVVYRPLDPPPPDWFGTLHVVISDVWSLGIDLTPHAVLRDPAWAWREVVAPQESRATPMGSVATFYAGETPILEIEFDPRFH
jgi:hypothetical protein